MLYAEDEPGLSEAVVDILTYYKYQVDAVDNGTDALAYAEAEHYDGIILDVMMPGLSGLEVLQKLRQEKQHQMEANRRKTHATRIISPAKTLTPGQPCGIP